MIRGLAVFCLLPSVLLGAPREGKKADADPLFPLAYGAPVAPVVYHAPNCTTVEETVTLKKCTPKHEKVCEDIEVPEQRIELEEVCNNITTVVCKPVIPKDNTVEEESAIEAVADAVEEAADAVEEAADAVEEAADEAAEVVKRAADPQLLAGLHPFAYHHPAAAVPVLYSQECEDKVEEHCHEVPTVKTDMKTVEACRIVTSVDCEDVEETVPRTSCTHVQHVVY